MKLTYRPLVLVVLMLVVNVRVQAQQKRGISCRQVCSQTRRQP